MMAYSFLRCEISLNRLNCRKTNSSFLLANILKFTPIWSMIYLNLRIDSKKSVPLMRIIM